jgi:hypothetical protein
MNNHNINLKSYYSSTHCSDLSTNYDTRSLLGTKSSKDKISGRLIKDFLFMDEARGVAILLRVTPQFMTLKDPNVTTKTLPIH